MNRELAEKCGVFGIHGDDEAARNTFFALMALQHRGQESAGIVSYDGYQNFVHKGMGLVAQVFKEEDIENLKGHIAIGHTRYSTFGKSTIDHCQPVTGEDNFVALAHNGNLLSVKLLREFLYTKGINFSGLNDSEMMMEVIRYHLTMRSSLEDAIFESYPLFKGAFSVVVLFQNQLAAFRDQCGIRPLSIGRLGQSFVFSSETCALDLLDASYEREIKPGELVITDGIEIKSYQIVEPNQKLDSFEFVYFARPDSILLGKTVATIRRNFGMQLAKEAAVDADVVVPVPDSGVQAAEGYAKQLKIPYLNDLIKNRYIGRTFIRPSQNLREIDVRIKLNTIRESLMNKRVVLLEDSTVRGTTSKKAVELVRRAGAREVHLRPASPKLIFPDFYGVDFPNQDSLIAFDKLNKRIKSNQQICEEIGADSVAYLSMEGFLDAFGDIKDKINTSCFSGIYSIDIGERAKDIVFVS